MKRIDTVRPPSIVRQDLPGGELESLEIVWSLDEQTSYFVRYLHICFELVRTPEEGNDRL